jgi:uncharacterized membrane protein SpoIIM required for sporulation
MLLASGVAAAVATPLFEERSHHDSLEQALLRPAPVTFVSSHNLRVLAVCASGLLTFGFSTLISLPTVAFATTRPLVLAIRDGVPVIGVAAATVLHAPFEAAALVLAGAAGLIPLEAAVALCRGTAVSPRVLAREAAMLVGAAVGLILIAAIVECEITSRVLRWTVAGNVM